MTNNPYEIRQNGSIHEKSIIVILKYMKYIKISKSYVSNIFIMENSSGKLFC